MSRLALPDQAAAEVNARAQAQMAAEFLHMEMAKEIYTRLACDAFRDSLRAAEEENKPFGIEREDVPEDEQVLLTPIDLRPIAKFARFAPKAFMAAMGIIGQKPPEKDA